MKVPTSTIVIDLAVLGLLIDGPTPSGALCAHVQAVCHPWLTPTHCVISDRLVAWMERGAVTLEADGRVALTPTGREHLRGLVARPAADHCHGLLPLVETLKLALADQLDPGERQALLHELVKLRARCLRAQSRGAANAPILLRRCTARRLHAAALAEEALARAIARYDDELEVG